MPIDARHEISRRHGDAAAGRRRLWTFEPATQPARAGQARLGGVAVAELCSVLPRKEQGLLRETGHRPPVRPPDQFVRRDGLTLKDVKVLKLDATLLPNALKNGSVDAAITSEPYITQMVVSGAGRVWKRGEDLEPKGQNGVLVFGSRLLDKNPKL